jgi:hypothetical protein
VSGCCSLMMGSRIEVWLCLHPVLCCTAPGVCLSLWCPYAGHQ